MKLFAWIQIYVFKCQFHNGAETESGFSDSMNFGMQPCFQLGKHP